MVNFERSNKNLGARVLKGTAVLAGARLIVRGFSLINIVILARLLTPEDYGIAALAIAAIAMFTTFSDLKITAALTGLDRVDAAHLDSAFTLSFMRGLVLSAIVFLTADNVARFMDAPQIADVLRLLSLMFLLDGVSNPAFWMYQRNIDFSREFGRATIAQAFASAITLSAAFYFRSYWAIVAGTLAGAVANTTLSYWRISYRPRFGLHEWRAMVSFGGWLTLSGMANQISGLASRVLIGKMLSPATLGIYTIGRETVSMPLEEMLGPLRRTFFPSFSAIKDDPERLKRTVFLALATLQGIALPVGVGIAAMSREIIIVLVGGKWIDAAIVLQLVGPTMALMLSASPITGLIMATGRLKPLFIRSMVISIIAWAGIYIGISIHGFEGAICAIALNQICLLSMNLMFMRQLTGAPIWQFFTNGWRTFVSAAVMASVLALVPRSFDIDRGSLGTLWTALPYVGLGGAVYCTTHLLLWRLSGRPDGFEANLLHYSKLSLAWAGRKLPGPFRQTGTGA